MLSLEHVGDSADITRFVAEHANGPVRRLDETGHRVKQGRLAGAVRSDQGRDTRCNVEVVDLEDRSTAAGQHERTHGHNTFTLGLVPVGTCGHAPICYFGEIRSQTWTCCRIVTAAPARIAAALT